MDIDKHIKKWLEDDLKDKPFDKSKEEFPENVKDIEEYKMIIEKSSDLNIPKGKAKEQVWEDLQVEIQSNVARNEERKLKKIIYFFVAAASVILFGLFLFINSSDTKEFVVKAGEHQKLMLPDSSELMINSVSKLSYSSKKWQKERLVKLDGEAFFQVKKGSRFTVETVNGKVEVKGTAFNVFSRDKLMEVKCTEGKVAVWSNTKETVLLKVNQAVKFLSDKKAMKAFTIEAANENLWLSGQFYFKKADLKRVFKEIERQFNVKIEFNDEINRTFSGYFSNKKLDNALQMVCNPMNLKFEILKNSKVVISQNTETKE